MDAMTDEQPQGVPATVTGDEDKVVVVTPEGMGVAKHSEEEPSTNPADLVEEPAKVMRIGSMVKQLLEEVRSAPLDDAGRARLADIHDKAVAELKDGLADELADELDRLVTPFRAEQHPSDAELRIAQAQLVGWLEGLFHGIQTALVAQQMAAQAQLQEMRRALPPAGQAGHPGPGGPGHPGGFPGMAPGAGQPGHGAGPTPGQGPGDDRPTGQYL
jgi:hypothetical protein